MQADGVRTAPLGRCVTGLDSVQQDSRLYWSLREHWVEWPQKTLQLFRFKVTPRALLRSNVDASRQNNWGRREVYGDGWARNAVHPPVKRNQLHLVS